MPTTLHLPLREAAAAGDEGEDGDMGGAGTAGRVKSSCVFLKPCANGRVVFCFFFVNQRRQARSGRFLGQLSDFKGGVRNVGDTA